MLLTVRTVISCITRSGFLTVIQPTASTFLVSLAPVCSALAGRPVTQPLTHDVCPLTPELLARSTAHRCLVRVSFLWAVAMALNGAVVLWLLLTVPAGAFPIERTGISVSPTATAIGLTVWWFVRTMRRTGSPSAPVPSPRWSPRPGRVPGDPSGSADGKGHPGRPVPA